MKFTYSNVTSTIALFAALTTGTSYAAATLARDSVRSATIVNGQVTLADLNPQVRARLAPTRKPTTAVPTPPTPTGTPGTWVDTGTTVIGPWTACTAACGEGVIGDYLAGPHVEATDIGALIGGAKKMNFRWTGSVTNTGTKTGYFSLHGFRGKTTNMPEAAGAHFVCLTPYTGIKPGETLTAEQLSCMNNHEQLSDTPAELARYIRTRVDLTSPDQRYPEGLTSTLRLEVQPIA